MKIELYQFDSFTSQLLSGNPAAVMPLESWPRDELMQKLARENNLSETAFLVPAGDDYQIRWFTPTAEVDLCGHATLAAAQYVLFHREPAREKVTFLSKSGPLHVRKDGKYLVMDFPSCPPEKIDMPAVAQEAFQVQPAEALACGPDLILVFESEEQLKALKPDFEKIKSLSKRGVVATARGAQSDFVSRAFFPQLGIPEDPVTGSTHCALTPYWSEKLSKKSLHARQLSERSGELWCTLLTGRVELKGQALLYLKGTVEIF